MRSEEKRHRTSSTLHLTPHSSPPLIVFPDPQSLASFMVLRWSRLCSQAIARRGRFAVALSGGKSPLLLYEMLAAHSGLNWTKTHIFLVDERFVSLSDRESNFGTISRILFQKVPLPSQNIHSIPIDVADSRSSAHLYEKEILRFFRLAVGEIPQFDLMLLGIGEDGHTASLFPGSPALLEHERLAVDSLAPRSPHERITITLPVINRSRTVVFLVTGQEKASILRTVIEGDFLEAPAAHVRPENGKIVFLCDRSAFLPASIPISE